MGSRISLDDPSGPVPVAPGFAPVGGPANPAVTSIEGRPISEDAALAGRMAPGYKTSLLMTIFAPQLTNRLVVMATPPALSENI